MPKDSVAANEAPGTQPQGGVENVDKIRDILFGQQMRDYERKFAGLEERILTEVGRVREETNQRIEALERYLNQELESSSQRLRSEQEERLAGQRGLAEELSKTADQLGTRLADLDDRLAGAVRDLRQQILDQSKRLSEEISVRHTQATEALDRTASELREGKLDRAALSGLLTELALHLSDGSPADPNTED